MGRKLGFYFKYGVFRTDPPRLDAVEKPVFQSDSYALACLAAWNWSRKTGLAVNVYDFNTSMNELRVDPEGFWYFTGNGTYQKCNPFGHLFDLSIYAVC